MSTLSTLFSIVLSVTAIDAFEFENSTLERRYQDLIDVVRCPKCLNTNLSGSDAPIAQDLRKLIYRLLHEGKTDEEIRQYLVDRYGDFILYDPPLSPKTVALLALPIIGVLLIAWVVLRLGVRSKPAELTQKEQVFLQELEDA